MYHFKNDIWDIAITSKGLLIGVASHLLQTNIDIIVDDMSLLLPLSILANFPTM